MHRLRHSVLLPFLLKSGNTPWQWSANLHFCTRLGVPFQFSMRWYIRCCVFCLILPIRCQMHVILDPLVSQMGMSIQCRLKKHFPLLPPSSLNPQELLSIRYHCYSRYCCLDIFRARQFEHWPDGLNAKGAKACMYEKRVQVTDKWEPAGWTQVKKRTQTPTCRTLPPRNTRHTSADKKNQTKQTTAGRMHCWALSLASVVGWSGSGSGTEHQGGTDEN